MPVRMMMTRALLTSTALLSATSAMAQDEAGPQPTHLVDASLTFNPAGKQWSMGLWARNLLDSRYLSTVYDSPGYGGLAGYAPPRQFGASASYTF